MRGCDRCGIATEPVYRVPLVVVNAFLATKGERLCEECDTELREQAKRIA